MSAKAQTKLLAAYIIENIPGEPSKSEGAGETAVRLLMQYRRSFEQIMLELGVPQANYPMPVSNAWKIARSTLDTGKA